MSGICLFVLKPGGTSDDRSAAIFTRWILVQRRLSDAYRSECETDQRERGTDKIREKSGGGRGLCVKYRYSQGQTMETWIGESNTVKYWWKMNWNVTAINPIEQQLWTAGYRLATFIPTASFIFRKRELTPFVNIAFLKHSIQEHIVAVGGPFQHNALPWKWSEIRVTQQGSSKRENDLTNGDHIQPVKRILIILILSSVHKETPCMWFLISTPCKQNQNTYTYSALLTRATSRCYDKPQFSYCSWFEPHFLLRSDVRMPAKLQFVLTTGIFVSSDCMECRLFLGPTSG